MRKMGASDADARKIASHRRSWWSGSHYAINKVLSNSYFAKLGLPTMVLAAPTPSQRTRTAGCGPARPVVWQGPTPLR